jgi:hypothetical protein
MLLLQRKREELDSLPDGKTSFSSPDAWAEPDMGKGLPRREKKGIIFAK